jgi:ribose transport system permease protein
MSLLERDLDAATADSRRADLPFRFAPRYRVVWIALAVLLILCAVSKPAVYHGASIKLITQLAGVLAIASAGQLIVIMSGGIDLSVPAMMGLAGAIIVKQTNGADHRLVVAIIEALVVAAAFGALNGILITYARLNALIVTLAMNGIVLGATVAWAGTDYSTTGQAPNGLIKFADRGLSSVAILGIMGLVVLGLLALALRNTAPGRSFVAAGTNRVAARIIGVRVGAYQVGGYVVASMLYMTAGILLAGVVQTPDASVGSTYQLATVVTVALGGASLAGGPASMLCTAGGCLFVSVLTEYLAIANFSAGVQQLANGVVLVAAVAIVTIRSGGKLRARAVGTRFLQLLGR